MRHRVLVTTLACVALPLAACAQSPQLLIPSFAHLQGKATESVDISIGPFLLGIAGRAVGNEDPEDAEAKKMLHGLKSVHVRSYSFDSDDEYSPSDIDAVRSQLTGGGWSQVAQIRDRKQNEDVDIYVSIRKEKIDGMAIVASEPRSFTIVNIVGSIDPGQFGRLRRQFNLPDAGVERLSLQSP